MEGLSQGGKGMSQVSSQWSVVDGLQRSGEVVGYRSTSQVLTGVEILVCG